ncbi:hypothetical protein IDSA_08845 [Pseudidiomarina salinarum]|uniref:Uncharacterized protein n=1 Tax=Pseudidiomarina salinarum TaxID=435908 RepID=A0A094IXR3_9GAMM|nr:hypothetical protein [Pseudidiomarina salinarum]KFZ30629.1 hypothetical protein IDSA_08845 [Pseudidiomarina salinarum]RUO69142.1 hypothetical protein CWI79_09535 [Pseudidiomarina salinarum]
MNQPHDYDPTTAPNAYLKRVFTQPVPRQITFSAMLGSRQIETISLEQYYSALAKDKDYSLIQSVITADKSHPSHSLHSPVRGYILVIDQEPVATFDSGGNPASFNIEGELEPISSSVESEDGTRFEIHEPDAISSADKLYRH